MPPNMAKYFINFDVVELTNNIRSSKAISRYFFGIFSVISRWRRAPSAPGRRSDRPQTWDRQEQLGALAKRGASNPAREFFGSFFVSLFKEHNLLRLINY